MKLEVFLISDAKKDIKDIINNVWWVLPTKNHLLVILIAVYNYDY